MSTKQHYLLTTTDLHVPGYQQTIDPGAIGTGRFWVDTSVGSGSWILKTRNATDTGWEILGAKENMAHGDLSDMPDTGGTNTDHDNRYLYQQTEISTSNITYVPIGGNIETYVTNATAGDTLVLAAGTYTIIDDIDVTKAINIVGQGIDKTTIYCTTSGKNLFDISSDNVSLSNLTVNYNGPSSGANRCIYVNGTVGTVFSNIKLNNIKIMVSATAALSSILMDDAGGEIRDVTIEATATGGSTFNGIIVRTNATAEANITLKCYNCNVISTGTAALQIAYYSVDNGSENDVFLYLHNCYATMSGGAANYGIYGTGADAYVYAYNSSLNGSTKDVFQSVSATVQLSNCTQVNGTSTGTITYDGYNTAENIIIGGGGVIRPSADSTTAINIAQADGTDFAVFDTTNKRMRLGSAVAPTVTSDITGALGVSTSGATLPTIGTVRTREAAKYPSIVGAVTGGYYFQNVIDTNDWGISVGGTLDETRILTIKNTGLVGIGTTAPLRRLDINEASGNCLRLIYNDADGSATYYADFLVSAAGELTITPTAGVTVSKTFTTSGGRIGKITTVTTTYTVLATDETVIGNSTTAFTITMPTAVVGQIFEISNINTGSVTVDGASSDTIDGQPNVVLSQWDSVKLQCYAANAWKIK